MTVVECYVELVFISMCYSKAIGVLRAKLSIPFHESVLIQFEFKRVQVLVSRPVNSAAIGKAPLLHRIFIKGDGCTRKQICIRSFKRRSAANPAAPVKL